MFEVENVCSWHEWGTNGCIILLFVIVAVAKDPIVFVLCVGPLRKESVASLLLEDLQLLLLLLFLQELLNLLLLLLAELLLGQRRLRRLCIPKVVARRRG